VPEHVDELFAGYADAFVRGERPSAEAYLIRAGEQADALARMIDRFVASAPAPAPDEAEVAVTAAWLGAETPLFELRVRRGIKREQLVDSLMSTLGLASATRAKVARYYHELETGLLDATRVDRRVWDALGQALRSVVPQPDMWRSAPARAQQAFYRVDLAMKAPAPAAASPAPATPQEPDEVDRLFGVGTDRGEI
jgi:hypothetical protein